MKTRLDYIRDMLRIRAEAKPLLALRDSGKAGPEVLAKLSKLRDQALIVDDFLKSGRLQ